MNNFESKPYRSELVGKIKDTPHDERKEILENAKETQDYWEAKDVKNLERDDEEVIDGGLGVLLHNKVLYHGTTVAEIKEFIEADRTTIGEGVYLTSEAKNAIGYARRRVITKNKQAEPRIYEAVVNNLKLLDLRSDENLFKILPEFKNLLTEKRKDPELRWGNQHNIDERLSAIEDKDLHAGRLRDVVSNMGSLWLNYVKSLGYDGLIALEGGEGDEVGSHDSYVIFDPSKVIIRQEQVVF